MDLYEYLIGWRKKKSPLSVVYVIRKEKYTQKMSMELLSIRTGYIEYNDRKNKRCRVSNRNSES